MELRSLQMMEWYFKVMPDGLDDEWLNKPRTTRMQFFRDSMDALERYISCCQTAPLEEAAAAFVTLLCFVGRVEMLEAGIPNYTLYEDESVEPRASFDLFTKTAPEHPFTKYNEDTRHALREIIIELTEVLLETPNCSSTPILPTHRLYHLWLYAGLFVGVSMLLEHEFAKLALPISDA